MRIPLSIVLLFLFLSGLTLAQDNSDPAGPNVTVLQKKWRVDVRNRALEKDPLEDARADLDEERQRIHHERTEEILRQQGMPPSNPPVRRADSSLRRSDTTPQISITYIYEMTVRNTGKKAIRAVSWDYVFFESGTERELGRRRFESKVRISPGKSGNVVARSKSSPTGTVDATKADKDSRDQYHEQIVIRSVEYTDGSVWQAGSELDEL